jgi:hypothetical protein
MISMVSCRHKLSAPFRHAAVAIALHKLLYRLARAVSQQSRDCEGADGEFYYQHPLLHSRGSVGLRLCSGVVSAETPSSLRCRPNAYQKPNKAQTRWAAEVCVIYGRSVKISTMRDQTPSNRALAFDGIIPRPPSDVAPLRLAFARMVSKQWDKYVPGALDGCETALAASQFSKGRFIGEMYARACYSMLLVSAQGPKSLRVPVRASAFLPQSRGLTIRFGSAVLLGMEQLLPSPVHRQLLLTSALMGMLDVVLDAAAASGEAAAIRVASVMEEPSPPGLLPAEKIIVALSQAARQRETEWQSRYWTHILQPAVRRYCQAEALAVEQTPDPTHMGHRGAGIEGVIKGMWYVIGPLIGLRGAVAGFESGDWNREQRWMADTTLLMQMIDDWVDQDEDRGSRLTPVVTGDWTLESAADLFDKTIRDLSALLDASGIQKPVLKTVLTDLYKDYLHTALDAMRTGMAA